MTRLSVFTIALVVMAIAGCESPGSSADFLPGDVGTASHDISVGPKADGIPMPDPDGQEEEVEPSPDALDNPDNGVTDAEVTLPELPNKDVDCGFVPLDGTYKEVVPQNITFVDLQALSDKTDCAVKTSNNPMLEGLTFRGKEAPLKAEVAFGSAVLIPDPESHKRFTIRSTDLSGEVVEHLFEHLEP